MTDQEIQAAAGRVIAGWRKWIDARRGTGVTSIYIHQLGDCLDAIEKAINPPTLDAADGEGWWWHVNGRGEVKLREVFAHNGAMVYHGWCDVGWVKFHAESGLWQRVIGPFGMEGNKNDVT